MAQQLNTFFTPPRFQASMVETVADGPFATLVPSLLSKQALLRLSEAKHRDLRNHDIPVDEGPANNLYFIVEGSLSVALKASDTRAIIVAYLNRGHFYLRNRRVPGNNYA